MRNDREFLIQQILAQPTTERLWGDNGAAHEVGCPDFPDLADLALDQIDGERAARLNQHCQGCPDCAARVAAYRAWALDEEIPEPPYEGSLLEMVAKSQFKPKSPPDR